MFPALTGTVRFYPDGDFRSCSLFLDFIHNLHAFKHAACILVFISLKVPALYIGFLFPLVSNGVEEDLVYLFGVHILGGA